MAKLLANELVLVPQHNHPLKEHPTSNRKPVSRALLTVLAQVATNVVIIYLWTFFKKQLDHHPASSSCMMVSIIMQMVLKMEMAVSPELRKTVPMWSLMSRGSGSGGAFS